MPDTRTEDKDSASARLNHAAKVLFSFYIPFGIVVSSANLLFGGIGRISHTSLVMAFVLILWGLYLMVRSVRGTIAMSLLDISSLLLPQIIFTLKGQDITAWFTGPQ